jgi:hypothetical protein
LFNEFSTNKTITNTPSPHVSGVSMFFIIYFKLVISLI